MEERINASAINTPASADFVEAVMSGLQLKKMDPLNYSSLALAYIGDDAYDLIIRTYLLNDGNAQVNKINKRANNLVKAGTQSAMMRVIEPMLNDTELGFYKRGRNTKSQTKAKNATVGDYRRATGFEALMGYLYLEGRYERMVELVRAGMEAVQENAEESKKTEDIR